MVSRPSLLLLLLLLSETDDILLTRLPFLLLDGDGDDDDDDGCFIIMVVEGVVLMEIGGRTVFRSMRNVRCRKGEIFDKQRATLSPPPQKVRAVPDMSTPSFDSAL